MSEYIVREVWYPGAVKQELVGELVRCRDCRKNPKIAWVECPMAGMSLVYDDGFCHLGERKEKKDAD